MKLCFIPPVPSVITIDSSRKQHLPGTLLNGSIVLAIKSYTFFELVISANIFACTVCCCCTVVPFCCMAIHTVIPPKKTNNQILIFTLLFQVVPIRLAGYRNRPSVVCFLIFTSFAKDVILVPHT